MVSAIVRWRWLILIALVAWTAVSAYYLTKIEIDTSLETWFLEDHASLVTYKQFRGQFGEDEIVLVGMEVDDVFTPEALAALQRLTRIAAEIPNVRKATSLVNVEVLQRQGRAVRSRPLMRQLPKSAEDAEALRKEASQQPMVMGNLVSANGRMAAVVVEMAHECDTFAKKAAVVHALEQRCPECLSQADLPARFYVAGTPVVSDAISRYMQNDLRRLTPIAMIVIVAATWGLFRRVSVPVLTIAVVAMAIVWTLGLMGMAGVKMNLLGPVLVSVILVVGVEDAIHIFTAYFDEFAHVDDPVEAIHRGMVEVLVPCFFTSVTTAIGFLSMISSPLEPISNFGWYSGLGTLLAFVITILLIPALVPLLKLRGGVRSLSRIDAGVDRVIGKLARPSRTTRIVVLWGSAALVLVSAWSIRYIEITANPMNYFHRNDPMRTAAETVDRQLGGAATLEFIVRAPEGGLKDLRVLRRLDDFEVWLADRSAVNRVMSFGALLKEIDRVQQGDDAQSGHLPRSNMALLFSKNIMERTAPEFLANYVRDDYSLGRISARVEAANADKLVAQAPEIEHKVLTDVNAPGLKVEPTGFVKLMDDMRSYLIRSQMYSILLTYPTIAVCMMLVCRSWKLGLFSMVPNVGPIFLGIAFMAFFDIRLDPGTVMIASIALGILVDDTCHFLIHIRDHVAAGMPLEEAVDRTMRQTGRPIILFTIILAAGFGTLILGSFTPSYCFGLVTTFVIVVGLVADLVILPSLLLAIRPRL